MRKTPTLLLLLIHAALSLHAQQKLTGSYNPQYKTFYPKDTGILVKPFDKDHLAPFMMKGKNPFIEEENHVGFIDTAGNIVISPEYTNCSYFENGYAIVMKSESHRYKYGLIDRSGKTVIPVEYSRISKCTNSLFMIGAGNKIGFVSIDGSVFISPATYTAFSMLRPVYREGDDVGHIGFRWENLPFYNYVQFNRYIGVKSGSKWAVIDSTGKEIVPPSFDGIEIFGGDVAPARVGSKFGLINSKGKLIIPALYDQIGVTGKDFVYVSIGQKTGVCSLNNKLLIPVEYNRIEPFGDNGFTAIDSEGKAMLFDGSGIRISNPVLYPTIIFPVWGQEKSGYFVYNNSDNRYHTYENLFDIATDEEHGRYRNFGGSQEWRLIFYQRHQKWGIIDTTGTEITPALYDGIDHKVLYYIDGGQNKLLAAQKNGKWGIITRSGKVLVQFDYDHQFKTDQGRTLIARNGSKYGVLSWDLKKLTLVKYDSVAITHDDAMSNIYTPSTFFISGQINKKWGLLNINGKELTEFKYDNYLWFYHRLAAVKIGGKYGVVNGSGKQIANCTYDHVFVAYRYGINIFDGRIIVEKNGLYGVIDSSGKEITPLIYDDVVKLNYAFAGKYGLTLHGKVGVLDPASGKVIIPCEYDEIKFNRDQSVPWQLPRPNVIAVKGGYYGVMDSTGRTLIPFQFHRIFENSEDTYLVVFNNRQGLYDKYFKLIAKPKYHLIALIKKDIYIVHGDDGMGLINSNGDIIADAIYQHFDFCDDNIIVKKGDKFGAINKQGEIIAPFIYSEIKCDNGALIKKL